jgi:hypothetical protein
MEDLPNLGRLERVKLRDVWKREDTVFTPWLSKSENLQLLADAIGVPELELIQTEYQVSEFSLDIVARVPVTGELVAIENQIEVSDHRHLGQSIVYAAGTEAKVIVWIVERFSEGHRAALDWLNRVTSDEIVFFGIEIEAWKIGDSVPAPKLNVVVRPNQWVRQSKRQSAISPGSAEGDVNARYWSAFIEAAGQAGLRVTSPASRLRNYYQYFGTQRTVALVAYIARASKEVGVFVGFYTPEGPDLISALEPHRPEIERELGAPYKVQIRSDASAWITGFRPFKAEIDDPADWSRQHIWLIEELQRLQGIWEPRLANVGAFGKGSD